MAGSVRSAVPRITYIPPASSAPRSPATPNAFTIPIVLQRLKRKSDPWSDYLDVRQKISRQALRFFA